MPRPLKVFLCHAHSDKNTVKGLYMRLKRESVDVWLDKEKLLPGADWEYEIRKAVRESDVVIVCLSKQFNQAGFRQKEVRIALEEADKKPEGEIFIIPARLEECDNLDSLSKWHWVDLFESDGFQRLILALRIRADKIGAALRQRGATLPRQKKNPEQQDAEKERIEQARRDAEEQERQKFAKEQADRESAEKAERDRLEKEAAEKAERDRLEKEAAEKAEHDRLERESAEKAERDRIEKEAAEKAERDRLEKESAEKAERDRIEKEAAEKAESDRLEKETAEKAERDRIEHEAAEKAERDRLEKESTEGLDIEVAATGHFAHDNTEREEQEKVDAEDIARQTTWRETVGRETEKKVASEGWEKLEQFKTIQAIKNVKQKASVSIFPALGIGGITAVFLLLMIFGGNYLLNNLPFSPTEISQTITVATNTYTPTKTLALTKTFTSKPPTLTPKPPTPTPTPSISIGSTIIWEDGMILVYVPAGDFIMGSDSSNEAHERPEHHVYLDAYWIDQTEVTNSMYAKCVKDGSCTPPSSSDSNDHNNYYNISEFDNYPVINVNWTQANEYCNWAGRDLPTEAEWEKAARGTDGRMYPWGNTSPDKTKLNYHGNVGDPTEVGSYPDGASVYAALDMSGNVFEWVSDWYNKTYYQTSPYNNPLGPDSGQYRVLKGGSWSDNYYDSIRIAVRWYYKPEFYSVTIGFRCAFSP